VTPAHKAVACEPERLERVWVVTFCAMGAGLAVGFYLARSGQGLMLEWVGIVQPALGSYITLKELARPSPRRWVIALGPFYALTTSYFGIAPAVRLPALLLALLPCVAAILQRRRLTVADTVAYCALLLCAKIHAVFGPPAAWL
jgi:hypothetical protein